MNSRLAPRTTREERASREPIARSRVAGDQRGDQRQQRVEVGGQVHVHVGEHRRLGRRPHGAQRAAAALRAPGGRHATSGSSAASASATAEVGSVLALSATVIRKRVREGARQVRVQPPDAGVEVVLLVVDGDDDVEYGRAGAAGGAGRSGSRAGLCGRGRQVLPGGQIAEVGSHAPTLGGRPVTTVWRAWARAVSTGGGQRDGEHRYGPGRCRPSTVPPCAATTDVHDGEAEAGAAGGPRAEASPRANRSKTCRLQLGRDAGAVVLDLRAGPAPGARPVTRAVTVVPGGVWVRALASRLASTWCSRCASPRDGDRVVRAGRAASRWSRPAARASLTASTTSGDRSASRAGERAAGVQPGEQQQVLDEGGHPGGLGLDPAQRVAGVGADGLVAAAGEFGVAADGGERGAQLVAGVGDELPYPRLALLPGVQRGTDVVEHPVERGADLADLGARVGVGLGHPLVQRDLAAVQGQFGRPGWRSRRPGAAVAGRSASMAAPASPAATSPAAVTETSTHIRVDRVSWTPAVVRPTSDGAAVGGGRRRLDPVVAEARDVAGCAACRRAATAAKAAACAAAEVVGAQPAGGGPCRADRGLRDRAPSAVTMRADRLAGLAAADEEADGMPCGAPARSRGDGPLAAAAVGARRAAPTPAPPRRAPWRPAGRRGSRAARRSSPRRSPRRPRRPAPRTTRRAGGAATTRRGRPPRPRGRARRAHAGSPGLIR